MIKKIFFSMSCLIFLASYRQMNPSLDALSSVIQLDGRYTFTNKEFARGFVKFNNGFDIPTNGTVFLNVGQYIQGIINMNRGTIVMTGPLYLGPDIIIRGNGFIKTNNNQIVFANTLSFTSGTMVFKDSTLITSLNSGTLFVSPPGKLVINNNNDELYFRRLKLFTTSPETSVLAAVGNNFWLEDVIWEVYNGGTLSLHGGTISMVGSCSFLGHDSTFSLFSGNKPWIHDSSNLTIGERTILKLDRIKIQELDSHLVLSHSSKLHFTSSDTLTDYGYLKVIGKAILSSNNNTVTFGSNNNIQYVPGGFLTLDKIALRIT